MIDLLDHEYAALADLVRAGSDGVELDGKQLLLSTAVRLEMMALARISHDRPQRVYVTQQGVAFSRRSVWA